MIYIARQSYPNELYHHGIKGQKWGVRRFQDANGGYTSAWSGLALSALIGATVLSN